MFNSFRVKKTEFLNFFPFFSFWAEIFFFFEFQTFSHDEIQNNGSGPFKVEKRYAAKDYLEPVEFVYLN